MLEHPLLAEVRHGFGLRGEPGPPGMLRPRQVHGSAVTTAAACRGAGSPPEADAVVATEPGAIVGVVTADCVPVLLSGGGGRAVAAIHAGWRGLACGVIGAGVDALRHSAGGAPLRAVIGPHIGPCCYEVDAPVVDALRARFDRELVPCLRPGRPGHVHLDLGALAVRALVRAGVAAEALAILPDACTRCDARRFHSHRRDGPRAGRLVHFVATAEP
jgi:YfiH family protein